MKNLLLKIALVTILLTLINGCCKPKIIVKKEYIECKYPEILDLNFMNDTNYTMPTIEYDIVKDFNVS